MKARARYLIHSEMINEVTKSLPEPFTTKQIVEVIPKRYSKIRPINVASLKTDIAGCCVKRAREVHIGDSIHVRIAIL